MCKNCAPYRDHESLHDHVPAQVESSAPGELSALLRQPLSRRQLIKAMGGGLAAGLTLGALGWEVAQGAAGALPYVVLIVLDGARAEYFNTPGIPTVSKLIHAGTQYSNA